MPLSLKTMEVKIKGDRRNKRFRTVKVYWNDIHHVNLLTIFSTQSAAKKTADVSEEGN